MKTMNILVALVATFVMTISASANTVNNNRSEVIAPVSELTEKGNTKVMYKGSNKIVFCTDDMGRVVSKMILHRVASDWVPVRVYTVGYGEKENTLTFARWNSDSHVFNRDAKQLHYDSKQFPVLIAMPK